MISHFIHKTKLNMHKFRLLSLHILCTQRNRFLSVQFIRKVVLVIHSVYIHKENSFGLVFICELSRNLKLKIYARLNS